MPKMDENKNRFNFRTLQFPFLTQQFNDQNYHYPLMQYKISGETKITIYKYIRNFTQNEFDHQKQ